MKARKGRHFNCAFPAELQFPMPIHSVHLLAHNFALVMPPCTLEDIKKSEGV
jgi:hypothetical protein